MPEPSGGSRGGLGTVRNATKLLSFLAEGPALQHLTDLAERSGMSVPTVHRLLRSLVLADFAIQDPTTLRYGLGPEISPLSTHYLSKHPVLNAVSPFVVALRDQFKQRSVHPSWLATSSYVSIKSMREIKDHFVHLRPPHPHYIPQRDGCWPR